MGERQGQRAAMDRFVKRLVDAGHDPKQAKKQAREEAVKFDRRQTKKHN